MVYFTSLRNALFAIGLTFCILSAPTAYSESAGELQSSARQALQHLYKTTPGASSLGSRAAGVLVFPEILKGGFVVAGHYGNGVLFKGDSVAGYYNTTAASVGWQAGVEKFGYALFFMTSDDLHYLDKSDGWEISALPSLTVVDRGVAEKLSSTSSQKGIYAFFFSQAGLMGGLSLEGAKITRIHPDK